MSHGDVQAVVVCHEDPAWLRAVSVAFQQRGQEDISTCLDARQLEGLLPRRPGFLVLDIALLHDGWRDRLRAILEAYPALVVVGLMPIQDVRLAAELIRLGLAEVYPQNTSADTIAQRVVVLASGGDPSPKIASDTFGGTGNLRHPLAFNAIVTRSAAMHALFAYVEAVGATAWPVLIEGESGVGKELFARAIHEVSGRRGTFVAVNTAGLDETMFSDTLFGHRRGAYTGADEDRAGLVDRARGGTLFLDEIGDLDLRCQVKLLRLLQEGEYTPLGADQPVSADVRVVVATNRDLRVAQDAGSFRQDLYYRLTTHRVSIPPLRDRLDDLPALLEHFLGRAAAALGKPVPTPPPQLHALLRRHHYPGNVRELEGMVMDSVTRHRGRVLSMEAFRDHILPCADEEGAGSELESGSVGFGDPLPTLKACTEFLIQEAMRRADNNQTLAARMLGMTRQALNRRLNRE